jgi:hypothetical protein
MVISEICGVYLGHDNFQIQFILEQSEFTNVLVV